MMHPSSYDTGVKIFLVIILYWYVNYKIYLKVLYQQQRNTSQHICFKMSSFRHLFEHEQRFPSSSIHVSCFFEAHPCCVERRSVAYGNKAAKGEAGDKVMSHYKLPSLKLA